MRTIASSTSLSVPGRVQTRESLVLEINYFGLTRATFRHVLTGSYHNYFRIFDVESLSDVVLQADKSAFKAKKIGGPLPGNKLGVKNGARGLRDAMQMETLDFNKKILHASWHPRENTIAVRSVSSFRRGLTMDIHLDRLDRCNEQSVPVQRRIVLVAICTIGLSVVSSSSFVAHPSSCRRLFPFSVLQYISLSLPFTSLTSSTLYFTAIVYHSPSRSFQFKFPFPLTPYLNVVHTPPPGPYPQPPFFLDPDPSASLTRSPSPLPTRVPISQCRVFSVGQTRS